MTLTAADSSVADAAVSTPTGLGGFGNVQTANDASDQNGGYSSAFLAGSAATDAEKRNQEQGEAETDEFDLFTQRMREHEATQRLRWQEQVSQWRKEAAEDPHIGGANLPVSVARAQLALDRFDEGKHIGRLLEQTGYGDNPAVLRFFNRVADALMEDGMVQGQPGSAMPPLEERMYAGWSSRR